MKQPHPAALAAADWWRTAITTPPGTNHTTPPVAHPELQALAKAWRILATELATLRTPTPAGTHKFAAKLADLVTHHLADSPEWGVALETGYTPGPMLTTAASTDIHPCRFPAKTRMIVYPNHVVVGSGWNAPMRLVWAASTWRPPVCGQRQRMGVLILDRTCSRPIYHHGDCGPWIPETRPCVTCGDTYATHVNRADADNPTDECVYQ